MASKNESKMYERMGKRRDKKFKKKAYFFLPVRLLQFTVDVLNGCET
jgi:hypothetical protein